MTQESETQDYGQELGRIQRPSAAQYQGKRRLLLVPLVYGPPPRPGTAGSEESEESAGQVILERYWDQAQTQISALESSLGGLRHIYHESLTEGGEPGLAYLQMADRRSHSLVVSKRQTGAALEATESLELLTETLDLQRCLMVPFSNEKVATRIQEWFTEGNRNRYQYIAQQIDQTLQADETGLLLISERHQVQFPADIEVFYVSPPALDEFRRWLQNWVARQQRTGAAFDAEDSSNSDLETGEGQEVAEPEGSSEVDDTEGG